MLIAPFAMLGETRAPTMSAPRSFIPRSGRHPSPRARGVLARTSANSRPWMLRCLAHSALAICECTRMKGVRADHANLAGLGVAEELGRLEVLRDRRAFLGAEALEGLDVEPDLAGGGVQRVLLGSV